MDELIEHGAGISGTAQTGIKNHVITVFQIANPNEIGCAHLTQLLVNIKIAVSEQRKRDSVGLPEVFDFVGRIADANADDLDLALEFGIRFDLFVNLVDSGSLPLAMRSVHAEDFNDHDIRGDIRDGEGALPLEPKIIAVNRFVRYGQADAGQEAALRRRSRGRPGREAGGQNQKDTA